MQWSVSKNQSIFGLCWWERLAQDTDCVDMLGCVDILSSSIVFLKTAMGLHGELAEVSWFSDLFLVKRIPAVLTKTIKNKINQIEIK